MTAFMTSFNRRVQHVHHTFYLAREQQTHEIPLHSASNYTLRRMVLQQPTTPRRMVLQQPTTPPRMVPQRTNSTTTGDLVASWHGLILSELPELVLRETPGATGGSASTSKYLTACVHSELTASSASATQLTASSASASPRARPPHALSFPPRPASRDAQCYSRLCHTPISQSAVTHAHQSVGCDTRPSVSRHRRRGA